MGKPARRLKIFHGPANIGGIGWRLSRLQRADGCQADFWTLVEHPRKQDADICLQAQAHGPIRRGLAMVRMFLFAVGNYQVFHFYFGVTLLPFGVDLPLLRLLRKRVVMTYAGSDVRLYSVDAARHHSPGLLLEAGYTPDAERRRRRRLFWQSLWCHYATAPRNLFAFANTAYPSARISRCWVNNIDIALPDHAVPFQSGVGRRLCVVHAPTSQRVKGTRYIEQAVSRLRQKGYDFEYRRIEALPHAEAQRLLRGADIVIDQLVVGGIGNLALEAMALGKTLLTYVYEPIMAELDDPPLVNVRHETLEDELRQVLDDESLRERLYREGPRFVRRYVDRRAICDEVYRLYGINPSSSS